ncbi:MAG: class I SAM-dependent methyltransferase, partial [Actinomycetota bacterium]
QLRDISRWSPRTKFDLVICQSVLQYLGDQDARRAIANLARSTKNLLYFEVPTKQDLRLTVDRTVTDLEIYSRDGAWYQSELKKKFRQIGAGLWVAKTSSIVLYELEAARSNRKT